MITISIQTSHLNCVPQINYVCQFLEKHPLAPTGLVIGLNVDHATIHINYGGSPKGDFTIPSQLTIFKSSIPLTSSLVANRYPWESETIYSVENKKKDDSPFCSNGLFGFDIIECIFFHISRFEEYHCPEGLKDEWDMMHEKHHFLIKHGLHHMPVVDQLVKAFFLCLGMPFEDQDTGFSLTHDIDVLQKFKNPIRICRSLIRSVLDLGLTGFAKTTHLIWDVWMNRRKDPYDSFDSLIVDSSTLSFQHLVLFIMAGGTSRHDNYYQVNDPYLAKIITKARTYGYQIGLHGSYHTDKNALQYHVEKANLSSLLSEEVTYSRQHFLHFDFKKTSQILEDNQIRFDSTIGYQRCIGFRCGTGFPYQMYDFSKKQAFRFKELPLVIMDGALLAECQDDIAKSAALIDKFMSMNAKNTHITINVHNTIFDPTKRDVIAMQRLYQQLLSYASTA